MMDLFDVPDDEDEEPEDEEPDVELPPPPTGPTAEEYTALEGVPEAFWGFLSTEDGRRFWEAIQDAALRALADGEERFSTRTFVALFRHQEKVRINDHFSPWFADYLIVRHPALLDIIERRRRKKSGPFQGASDE